MDEEGYVNIRGRLKDVVIRGGENISPREVEELLHTHPLIKDVAVVGVPDPKYGEELCAWVVPKAAAALGAAEVRDFCRGKVAHYKVPKHVKLVAELPMTVTGKIQKYRMREESIRELGLEGAAAIVTA
jgi:fatty-acyl-CoA synthase